MLAKSLGDGSILWSGEKKYSGSLPRPLSVPLSAPFLWCQYAYGSVAMSSYPNSVFPLLTTMNYFCAMEPIMPDLRNEEPGREKIDKTNIVISDIVRALAEYDRAISRFTMTAESKFGLVAVQRGLDLIDAVQHLNRRMQDIRRAINAGEDV